MSFFRSWHLFLEKLCFPTPSERYIPSAATVSSSLSSVTGTTALRTCSILCGIQGRGSQRVSFRPSSTHSRPRKKGREQKKRKKTRSLNGLNTTCRSRTDRQRPDGAPRLARTMPREHTFFFVDRRHTHACRLCLDLALNVQWLSALGLMQLPAKHAHKPRRILRRRGAVEAAEAVGIKTWSREHTDASARLVVGPIGEGRGAGWVTGDAMWVCLYVVFGPGLSGLQLRAGPLWLNHVYYKVIRRRPRLSK